MRDVSWIYNASYQVTFWLNFFLTSAALVVWLVNSRLKGKMLLALYLVVHLSIMVGWYIRNVVQNMESMRDFMRYDKPPAIASMVLLNGFSVLATLVLLGFVAFAKSKPNGTGSTPPSLPTEPRRW